MPNGLTEVWMQFLASAREGLFMSTLFDAVIIGLSFIAALFAFLAFLRAGHLSKQMSGLLRSDTDPRST